MENLKVVELREIARSRGLKGWYRLRKSDFISFIMEKLKEEQKPKEKKEEKYHELDLEEEEELDLEKNKNEKLNVELKKQGIGLIDEQEKKKSQKNQKNSKLLE